MKWDRWKVGLLVAMGSGALTGFLCLAIDLTWKQALFLIGKDIATTTIAFLKDHPVKSISFGTGDTEVVPKPPGQ